MTNKYLLISLSLVLSFSACRKDEEQVNGIPNVMVNVQININNPAYFDLSIPGGWVYHAAGSRGLILYRRNTTDIIAMDRHCPYRPQDGCAVSVDESGIVAEDDCCGSRFSINDASVLEGPAAQSLRTYNTTFDGTILMVFN